MRELMKALPWYRQPWPWFLIALPASAVVGGVITATLAVRTNDEVVAPDYYRRGLGINQELARREKAAALGLKARLSAADAAQERLSLRIEAQSPLPPDAALRVYLIDRSGSGGAIPVVFARTAVSDDARAAIYSGMLAGDLAARYEEMTQMVIESSTWRLEAGVEPGTQPVQR